MADRARSCLFGDPRVAYPTAGSDTGSSLVSGASRASLTMAATHLFREALDVSAKRILNRAYRRRNRGLLVRSDRLLYDHVDEVGLAQASPESGLCPREAAETGNVSSANRCENPQREICARAGSPIACPRVASLLTPCQQPMMRSSH